MNNLPKPKFSPEPDPMGEVSFGKEKAVYGPFRIGNPEVSREVVINKQRTLVWREKPGDREVAQIAGWKELAVELEPVKQYNAEHPDERVGAVVIPTGTRTAESVIAGFEAWAGEKGHVLDFVTHYTDKVKHAFDGKIDTSVTLKSVAVTRDGDFFVAPPHNLTQDQHQVEAWVEGLVQSADQALQDTMSFQPPEELVNKFRHSMDDVLRSGNE